MAAQIKMDSTGLDKRMRVSIIICLLTVSVISNIVLILFAQERFGGMLERNFHNRNLLLCQSKDIAVTYVNNTQANISVNTLMPSPPCTFGTTLHGYWTSSWSWQDDAGNHLLSHEERQAIVSTFTHMVFLGDSKMLRLFYALIAKMELPEAPTRSSCVKVRAGGRCEQLRNYYSMESIPLEAYIRPNSSQLEGPAAFGLDHAGCSDCSGCDNALFQCHSTDAHASPLALEYLQVEFAKDFEMQSVQASTTQELVSLYLTRSLENTQSALVVNTGIHEMVMLEDLLLNRTLEELSDIEFIEVGNSVLHIYTANMAWYLGLLRRALPGNSPALVLATAPMREPRARMNSLIRKINAAAASVASEQGFGWLDASALLATRNTDLLYTDDIHAGGQNGIYYSTLADVILQQLRVCGP